MEKKSLLENISEIGDNLRLYLETKVSLYQITALDKATKALIVIVALTIGILFFTLSLIFFSGAAAIYIGELLESTTTGLLIVGGFYFVLGSVFLLLKRQIFSRYIIRFLVAVFFRDDDEPSNTTNFSK